MKLSYLLTILLTFSVRVVSAEGTDDLITNVTSGSSSARAVCESLFEAEAHEDWQRCYELLDPVITRDIGNASQLSIFLGVAGIELESDKTHAPVVSTIGKGPDMAFIKLWKPLKDAKGFYSIFFVVRRQLDLGHWRVVTVFPSRLTTLCSRFYHLEQQP